MMSWCVRWLVDFGSIAWGWRLCQGLFGKGPSSQNREGAYAPDWFGRR